MSLRERAAREKEAYDASDVQRRSHELLTRYSHVFRGPNGMRAEEYLERVVREKSAGAAVLDYGCGTGWLVPGLVKSGATRIVGIDVAEGLVEQARGHFGNLAEFHCMDGHRTAFPDGAFDLVVGRAILHHMEFDAAVREIHRVLRPGGAAVFLEPLRDNPAFKLARLLTPEARTKDELPLSRDQVRWADAFFGRSAHLFANLVSAAVGAASSLVSRNPANLAMRIADRADVALSRTRLRYWMLQAVLVWEKCNG